VADQNLVQNALNELLFERSVGEEKLSHEIADKEGNGGRARAREKMEARKTHKCSKGEMKTSLRLIIWRERELAGGKGGEGDGRFRVGYA